MTESTSSIDDGDLHAFVDGQLDAARLPAVLAYLRAHPEQAVRAAEWQAQRSGLRAWHRAQEPGATPGAMAATVMRHRRRRDAAPWARAAAAVALLAIGAAAGHFWPGSAGPADRLASAPAFVRDAAVAYAVYTPEVRHPVEVSGSEQDHLVQWLSRRLGRPLHAPVLQDRGFRLLGGRLLPGAPAPRAQFMYEDARGRRTTLYVAVFPDGAAPRETAFRSLRKEDGESFYWMEDGYGYALSADLPTAELQALAREVYAQLYPGR